MRLLQVTTIPETAEAFLLPFAHHFRQLGWQVDGAANGMSQNAGCVAAFDTVHDVSWKRQPLDPANFASGKQIRMIVLEGGYDLVHVHTPVAAFVTRMALRQEQHVPVVYTAHGFHFFAGGNPVANAIYRALEKTAGPFTDQLVVINDEDLEAVKRFKIVPENLVRYIPGIGIDLVQMTAARRKVEAGESDPLAVRRELGIPFESPLFVMVAEFTPRKRHVDALTAFAALQTEHPAHLLLVGMGPLQASVAAMVSKLGLTDRVHVLGYRHDVPLLVIASDILVLVSSQEGLPRSIMEAMALGTPVIGTDIRGVRDLLKDGAGRLVPLKNVDALTLAMKELADSSELRGSLAAKARQRVEEYALPEVLRLYEQVYSAALAQV